MYSINSNNIKVSIIVPCFNVEKYILECLNSIKKQTLKEIEVLCINDGSTDKTFDIITDFSKNDKRFVVINKNNTGYGDTVNIGIKKARGKYIGIVESDDFIDAEMYKTLFRCAEDNNVDYVKSNYYRYCQKSLEEMKATNSNKFFNKVINYKTCREIFNFEVMNWTGIYNREFIIKHNICHSSTPGASFQDTGFWFMCCAYAKKALYIDKTFYYYRIDNPNSSINSKEKVFCINYEYKRIRDILIKNKLFNDLKGYFCFRKHESYMFNCSRMDKKYRMDFLCKYKEEIDNSYRNNEICLQEFPPIEKREFNMIKKSLFDDNLNFCELNLYLKIKQIIFKIRKLGLNWFINKLFKKRTQDR